MIVGHVDDDNVGVFGEIDDVEGEWPTGKAVLKPDGGPRVLNDPCDDPLDW